MNGIDGLLNIAKQQRATELRLKTNRSPELFRHDAALRLTMPAMGAELLRSLLGEIWTQHSQELLAQGRVSAAYTSSSGNLFRVVLTGSDEDEFGVSFSTTPDEDEADLQVEARGGGELDLIRGQAPTGSAAEVYLAPVIDQEEGPERASMSSLVEPNSTPTLADELSQAKLPSRSLVSRTVVRGADGEAYRELVSSRSPTAGSKLAQGDLSSPMMNVLRQAIMEGASDVHLGEQREPVCRVDGRLQVMEGVERPDPNELWQLWFDGEPVPAIGSRDFGLDLPGLGRFRVNVYHYQEGTAAAIRILRRHAPRLEDLSLSRDLRSLLTLPHGLIILCGPTGSGKSTTLAALAQEAMYRQARLLITLEDPIEYLIRPVQQAGIVRQRQVGHHVESFAAGLRDALREDPDILLIGEMRDPETISMALTPAETGHLVLTSLHSRTSASAVERIVDSYPAQRQAQIRVQLADSLAAVVSQRLLPKLGGRGRVPASEVLRVTYPVANLIREGKTEQIASAIQSGRDEGMVPLERNLAELVDQRQVSFETARLFANDLDALVSYMSRPSSMRR